MDKNYLKIWSTFLLFLTYFLFTIASTDESSSGFSRVESASTKQFEKIKYGLKKGNRLSKLNVVKSKDFSNIYFAATKINNQIAIWAISGSKTSPNMIFSVNNYALTISDYPDGKRSKAQMKESDDGIQLLKNYLSKENK